MIRLYYRSYISPEDYAIKAAALQDRWIWILNIEGVGVACPVPRVYTRVHPHTREISTDVYPCTMVYETLYRNRELHDAASRKARGKSVCYRCRC